MKRILLAVTLCIVSFTSLYSPKQVFAQGESIKNFDVSVTAQKNGLMQIQEVIRYDFADTQRHGIYRYIPLVSQVGNLYRIISLRVGRILRDGKDEQYSVTASSQTTSIKIGNPEETITGIHTYTINYSVTNGIGSNYADHDEIYWNVTGNQWTVPIASASVVITTDFGVFPGKTVCYTGPFGATTSNCQVESNENNKRIVTTIPLSVSEGLTVVTSFPVHTFPKSILQTSVPSISHAYGRLLNMLIPIYLMFNLLIAPGLIYWYFKHKRKNRFGPITVNFDVPKDTKGKRILPAEAGTIDTAKLEKNDLIATIFDLAIRKYVRIDQVEEKGSFLGFGKKEDYKLVKLKHFADLSVFEKSLMQVVFEGKDTVFIKDVQVDLIAFSDLEDKNFSSLISRGFYTKNPQGQMSTLLTLGIFLTVTLNLFLGPVLIFLSRKLNGRTALGDTLDWKIDGLKLFLKNMSREYTWQAKKAYVVEAMIPYAIALGYINEYMKQVKIHNPNYQPSWYVGAGGFYAMYPAFYTSWNNAIVTAAPASSSGFSGGFSGGGGGGGGGGSW